MARIGRPMARAASAKIAHKMETKSNRLFGVVSGAIGTFAVGDSSGGTAVAGAVAGAFVGAARSSGAAFALLIESLGHLADELRHAEIHAVLHQHHQAIREAREI